MKGINGICVKASAITVGKQGRPNMTGMDALVLAAANGEMKDIVGMAVNARSAARYEVMRINMKWLKGCACNAVRCAEPRYKSLIKCRGE